jgi:hypothetical protein
MGTVKKATRRHASQKSRQEKTPQEEVKETTIALTSQAEYEIGIYQYGKLFNARGRKAVRREHGDD